MNNDRTSILLNMVRGVEDKNIHSNEVFEYTQTVRRNVLEEMLDKGNLADFEQQRTILTALKDMDKQQVDRSRLQIDDKNGATNEMVLEIVSNMSKRFPRGMAEEPDPTGKIPTMDDSALEDIDVPEDEKEVGLIQTTSKEFVAEHGS